jgi:uncharacterized YigZ family protein
MHIEKKDHYSTLERPATGDFRDRGSKFLAFAYPVTNISEAKIYIQQLKKEHPKAVHHCLAYRIGTDGTNFRAPDDGEPSGSAGKPILGQRDSMGLTNVLVVVVRYFGGTLLGVPGLINAYKTATRLALESVATVVKWVEMRVLIKFNYPAMGEVLYLLKQADASIYRQEMQLFCEIEAGIPVPNAEKCILKLKEMETIELQILEKGPDQL